MTKVDIISGFLGAGKTTLIKKLVNEVYQGEKIVLIENEFGEIGIDGTFMNNAGVEVTEINSGCICCSLVGDFEASLKEVLETYEPDRIIIEPSGVGKLSDVIKAVNDVHSDKLVLDNYLAVIDAKKCRLYTKNFGEFFNNQIQYASLIILSRTQDITEFQLDECLKIIRNFNPKVNIVTTPWDQLTKENIINAFSNSDDLQNELLEQLDICPECGHHHDHEHKHHHEHEHHHHADEVFTSWGIETVHKFSRAELEDLLKLLSMTQDFGTVLRAKGIVQTEEGGWLEFDMVPEETEIRDCKPDYIGRICVIGTELKKDELEKVFAK